MKEKKFNNSFLIEGNYNYNYLTNMLSIARDCLSAIIVNKNADFKKNKKLFKNFKNLYYFFDSSIELFNRLANQEQDKQCVIHNVEYSEEEEEKKDLKVEVNDFCNLASATAATVEEIKNSFKETNKSKEFMQFNIIKEVRKGK